MINQESIKKNLFTIKKIVVVKNDTWGSSVRDIASRMPLDIKEMTGILVPCFDKHYKTFDNAYLKAITLDGMTLKVKADCVEIKKTRITDSNLKEEVNKLIEFLKEDYKFQKEQVKFYENLKKKEEALSDKTSKHEKTIASLINQVKKSQGTLSHNEVLNSLNKVLNLKQNISWTSDEYNSNVYFITSGDNDTTNRIDVIFSGSNITSINISKEVLIDVYAKFTAPLDKINLESTKEFELLKKSCFKILDDTKLSSIKAMQEFSLDFVEDDFATIRHDINLPCNMKATVENMKDIKHRLGSLLKLF